MPNRVTNRPEPLVSKASITAVAAAVLGVVVAAGLPVSDEMQGALMTLVGVLAPFVVALWGRRDVTPVE